MLCLSTVSNLLNKQNLQFIHIINATTYAILFSKFLLVSLFLTLFSFHKIYLSFHLLLFTLMRRP